MPARLSWPSSQPMRSAKWSKNACVSDRSQGMRPMAGTSPTLCGVLCSESAQTSLCLPEETAMRALQHVSHWVGVLLVSSVACTGCTYAALRNLSPDERAEFHTYSKVMTTAQEHTSLAKLTAAERTAYLGAIGLVQRFQALDPLDRDAVLGGVPRQGMSAEVLLFLWGAP